MAEQGGDQDKSEPATAFKLEEARKKGQVFRSTEINSIAIFAAALLCMLAFADWSMHRITMLMRQLMAQAGQHELTIDYVMKIGAYVGKQGLYLISPLLFVVALVGILANLLQAGFVFSFFPLKPDLSRINPVTGFKRVFALRSLYEGLKTGIKLTILGVVVHLILRYQEPRLFTLPLQPIETYPLSFKRLLVVTMFGLLLGFLALSVVDFTYSRWEFHRKLRMSRRELKDEVKRREGDPQVRSKRRELQRSMRKKVASLTKVSDADVLITNPTHYAVALQYRQGETSAPKLLAKGAGDLALQMRRLAFQHGVAVVTDAALARKLYRAVDIDQLIPEDTYAPVAIILRRVLARRDTGVSKS